MFSLKLNGFVYCNVLRILTSRTSSTCSDLTRILSAGLVIVHDSLQQCLGPKSTIIIGK